MLIRKSIVFWYFGPAIKWSRRLKWNGSAAISPDFLGRAAIHERKPSSPSRLWDPIDGVYWGKPQTPNLPQREIIPRTKAHALLDAKEFDSLRNKFVSLAGLWATVNVCDEI